MFFLKLVQLDLQVMLEPISSCISFFLVKIVWKLQPTNSMSTSISYLVPNLCKGCVTKTLKRLRGSVASVAAQGFLFATPRKSINKNIGVQTAPAPANVSQAKCMVKL